MNSHYDINKLLPAYCGDDLPMCERAVIDKHLQECAVCRAELADLRTTLRLIRSTPDVDPPPWLTTRIMAHVRDKQTAKQGWLQRFFFPLHIKIPLEAAALLVVCISGYYFSRSMETELGLTAPQNLQEMPVNPPHAQRPTAAESAGRTVPRIPATSRDVPAVSAPVVADKPAAPPFVAPAPVRNENYAPATRDGDYSSHPPKVTPMTDSSIRAPESAAPMMKKKSARSTEKREDTAVQFLEAAPASRAAKAPSGSAHQQLTIQLRLTSPMKNPASIRDEIIRSGGSIIDEAQLTPGRIRARVHTGRIDELLDRLGTIGKIVDRPHLQYSNEIQDVSIIWDLAY